MRFRPSTGQWPLEMVMEYLKALEKIGSGGTGEMKPLGLKSEERFSPRKKGAWRGSGSHFARIDGLGTSDVRSAEQRVLASGVCALSEGRDRWRRR